MLAAVWADGSFGQLVYFAKLYERPLAAIHPLCSERVLRAQTAKCDKLYEGLD